MIPVSANFPGRPFSSVCSHFAEMLAAAAATAARVQPRLAARMAAARHAMPARGFAVRHKITSLEDAVSVVQE